MRLMTSMLDRILDSLAHTPLQAPSVARRARNSAMQRAVVEALEPRMLMSAAVVTNLTATIGSLADDVYVPVSFSWENHEPGAVAINVEAREVDAANTNWFQIAHFTSPTANSYISGLFQIANSYEVRINTITADGTASAMTSFTTSIWESGPSAIQTAASSQDGWIHITKSGSDSYTWFGFERNASEPFPNRWTPLVQAPDGLTRAGVLGPWTTNGWEVSNAWSINGNLALFAGGTSFGDTATLTTSSHSLSIPGNLTGTRNADSVTLEWSGSTTQITPDPNPYIYYEVQTPGLFAGATYTTTYFSNATSITISAEEEAGIYPDSIVPSGPWDRVGYFFVQAWGDTSGDPFGQYRSLNSAVLDLSVARAPSNLLATSLGDGSSVFLSWSDNAYNETRYDLYRLPGRGDVTETTNGWIKVAELAEDATGYNDNGRNFDGSFTPLMPGQTYHYGIQAVRGTASLNSPWALARTRSTTSDDDCTSCGGMIQTASGASGGPAGGSNGGISNVGGESTSISSISGDGTDLAVKAVAMRGGDSMFGPGTSSTIPTLTDYRGVASEGYAPGTIVIAEGTRRYYWDYGSNPGPLNHNPYSLTWADSGLNDGNRVYTLIDGANNVLTFTCSENGGIGKFQQWRNLAGNTIVADYNTNDQLHTLTENLPGNHTATLTYTYVGSGAVEKMELSRDNATISSLSFAYDQYGHLSTVSSAIHTGASAATTETTHLQFSGTSSSAQVEQVLSGENQVGNYYQYDSAGRIQSITRPGQGTATFDYVTKAVDPNANEINTWVTKRVEYQPGYNLNDSASATNTQIVTYSNYLGQTILQATIQPGKQSIDYYRYDTSGTLIVHAYPSAVTGYNELYGGLVDVDAHTWNNTSPNCDAEYLADDSGVIEYTDYGNYLWTGTTYVPFVRDTFVTQGDGGPGGATAHYQSYFDYTDHSFFRDGVMVQQNMLAESMMFTGDVTSNPASSESFARVTQYSYGWQDDYLAGTTYLQMITTTSPGAGIGHNGSGAYVTTKTVLDSLGRTIWSMDADEFINYNEYDPLTGSLVKTITDVDHSLLNSTELASFPATGFPYHSSGLHLVTTYGIDSQGRTTRVTDPNGNTSYTIYDDAHHATFSVSGASLTLSTSTWGTLTAVTPISMSRDQILYAYGTLTGTYSESLTFSGRLSVEVVDGVLAIPGIDWTSTVSAVAHFNLIGTGSSESPQFTIQSLSRSLYNAGSQLVESDAYFNIDNDLYLSTGTMSAYAGPANTANPLTNGSFEEPSVATCQNYTGNFSVNGWTGYCPGNGQNGNAGLVRGTSYGLSPDDGQQQFTFNGANPPAGGYIEQTFATTPGRLYQVEFAVGHSGANGAPLSLNAHVFDDSSAELAGVSATPPTNAEYRTVTFQFVADSATSRLRFTDTSGYNPISDLFVDGVSVTGGNAFYATFYGYDEQGRQARTVSPTGTITDITYDGLGRQTGTYIGTDDTPGTSSWDTFLHNVTTNATNVTGTNMTLVSLNRYDSTGHLTQTTAFPGGGQSNRVTLYLYDGQDRLITTLNVTGTASGTHAPVTVNTLDNLGEVTGTYQYDNDRYGFGSGSGGAALDDSGHNGIPDVLEASNGLSNGADLTPTGLVAASTIQYDEQGRAYKTFKYNVDADGTFSTDPDDVIVSESWFDNRGNTIASWTSGGAMTKNVYDGAGRLKVTYTTDGGAVYHGGTITGYWSDASAITNDIVLSQVEYTYDAAGNVILTTDREAFHDNTGYGALGEHDDTNGRKARVSYVAHYYDAAGRTTYTVNVGTNGGAVFVRPVGVNNDSRSDTMLITSYSYNDAGLVATVADPRGIVTATAYDNLGRQMTVTVNSTATSSNEIQITRYTYDAASHILSMTAVMPGSTPSQITNYLYGVTTAQGSVLNSNDLLYQVAYPTPSGPNAGQPGTTSALTETYTYDALGEVLTKTGRDGNSHAYTYDTLGRQVRDSASLQPNLHVNLAAPVDLFENMTFSGDSGWDYNEMYLGGLYFWVESNGPGDNGSISTTFTVPAGDYALRFDLYEYSTGQLYIYLDGTPAVAPTVSFTLCSSFVTTATEFLPLAAGSHTLTLQGTSDPGAGQYVLFRRFELCQPGAAIGTVSNTTPKVVHLDPGTYFVFGTMNTNGWLVGMSLGGTTIADLSPSGNTGPLSVSDKFTVTVPGDYALSVWAEGGSCTFESLQLASVNTVGTIVASQRVETSYNALGQIDTVTSYNLAEAGAIVNQVRRDYNGFGQLTREYQAHDGAVDTGSTLSVAYAYADADHGARLTQMTYPDNSTVGYNYGTTGSLNDVISRLDHLSQGTVTLESYKYLGLATVIERDHPQDGVNLTYIGTLTLAGTVPAGDIYGGLDRFGRVIDQKWTTGVDGGTGTVKDEYVYTYDRDGNVTSKLNWAVLPPVNPYQLAETYSYDGLNRLTSVTRGSVNATTSQMFSLDAVGNITSVTDNAITMYRTVNSLNQLVATGTDSQNQAAISYDANGNMIADDQGRSYIYDAWNRLIAVDNADTTLLVAYTYDGFGRRTQEITVDSGLVLHSTDLYFSAAWQVLEERQDGQTAQRNYYSPVYVNAIIARDDDTDANGVPDRRLYVTQDANFNSMTVLDSSGNIQEHFVYDAYGKKTTTSDQWVAQSSDTLNFRNTFQGGREDLRTGLINFQRRDYNPRTYTWNTADPLGYVDGMSRYPFVRGNPVKRVDWSGTVASPINTTPSFNGSYGAHWDEMFKTWFLELNGSKSATGGTWATRPLTGRDHTTFGTTSPYSRDIANSPSMISMDPLLSGPSIKKQFLDAMHVYGPQQNPMTINWGFTGPGSLSGKYTIVEWFLGSYRAKIDWRQIGSCKYEVHITLDNTSGWYSATRLPKSWQNRISATLGTSALTNAINDRERGSSTPSMILGDMRSTLGPQASAGIQMIPGAARIGSVVSGIGSLDVPGVGNVAAGSEAAIQILESLGGKAVDTGAAIAGQPSFGGDWDQTFVLPTMIWSDQ
jgi:RHS repeat-associated protein